MTVYYVLAGVGACVAFRSFVKGLERMLKKEVIRWPSWW